jgi:phosphatidylglycerophosphate synthase
MLEKWIRPIYQQTVIDPFLPLLSKLISPAQATIVAGILGMIASLFLSLQHLMLATICLVLSGIVDTLDGSLARHSNTTSSFGCALDIFTDRVVECAIIIGLCVIDMPHRTIPSLLMLGSITLCITSFLVVGIFTDNQHAEKSFYYSIGLMERFEAFVFFIAMIWLAHWFAIIAYLFTSLVLVTAFIRLYQFKKGLDSVFNT